MACVYLRSLLRSAPCPNVTCIKVEESAAGHSHWGKEETLSTITLTCSTAVWLISWINHHLQGLHSSSITPFAFLADFFLLHPSILSVTTFFPSYTSCCNRPARSAAFIYHTIVALLNKAPHLHWLNSVCESCETQIIPHFGFDSRGSVWPEEAWLSSAPVNHRETRVEGGATSVVLPVGQQELLCCNVAG